LFPIEQGEAMTEKLVSNDDTPALQAINTATGAAIFADGTGNTGAGGLAASSVSGIGVHSANHTPSETAIFGINDSPGQQFPDGGKAGAGSGVWGHTRVEKAAGVVGSVEPGLSQAAGVVGIGPTAGRFFGNVGVTGSFICQGQEPGDPPAVKGISDRGDGVQGICSERTRSGLTGIHTGGGRGLTAVGSPAGHFDGNVEVTGDILLINHDCAEEFDIVSSTDAEPGTVMVLDESGALQPSSKAYDKKVAGVVSGAGDFKPGIILGKLVNPASEASRMPIALLGKVYCKVDARNSPIEVGDLLTTSNVPGHAMKVEDPQKAFGAVIGKALSPLREERGLVPILVALQ
jgi:hypothetical protein